MSDKTSEQRATLRQSRRDKWLRLYWWDWTGPQIGAAVLMDAVAIAVGWFVGGFLHV